MPVPKKARALERGVVSTKATAKAAVSAVKKAPAKKTPAAKKGTETTTPKTPVAKKPAAKATIKAASKKVAAKKTEAKKKVQAKALPKAAAVAEEMISIDASSGVGVILKEPKKLTKGTAAYTKAAMKMAGQVVKGKPNRRADKAREKVLEALLRRNGVDEKPAEVSVETSYRVGEDEQGVTLFSRIKTERTVILTARVFGFGFVVLGACFTLLTVNRVLVPDSPLPLLSAFDKQLASIVPGTYDSTLQNPIVPTAGSLPAPVAPTVDFLSLPSSEVTGVVEISFMVPANTVMVDVYNRDTKQWKKLGSAKTSDQQVWKLGWNTANFLPGTYDVVAIVTNAQGTFHVKSDRSVEVADQTTATSNTTTTSGSSTTTNTATTPLSTVFNLRTPLSAPLTSRSPIYLSAANVSSIKATLLQESTKKIVDTFTLNNLTTSEWRFYVDPTNYPEGEYSLKFNAQTNNGTIISSPLYKLSFATAANTPAATSTATSDEDDIVDEEEVANDEETAETASSTQASAGLPTARIRSDSTTGVGYVVLFAETEKAIGAEFYARPAGSLKDVYIGLGTKVDEDTWRLVWDTKQTPNGTYEVFSRHRSLLGVYSSAPISVSVKNLAETTLTNEQKAAINEIANTESLAPNPVKTFIEAIDPTSSINKATSSIASTTPKVETADDEELPPAQEERPRELLPYFTYRSDIEKAMTEYGKALRTSDAATIDAARVAVLELKKEMVNSINPSDPELRERLTRMVEDDVRELTQEVEEVEEIIRARVGEAAAKDSDRDTITDYDEVNLYKTNPFSADTDGDGFTDAAEITGGYDPLNDAPESLIAFESPKEAGVVREDILSVTGIAAAEEVSVDTNDDAALKVPTAVITGKALPNSFVTIYIYSTPIIVTVKTNDDGSWSYRFDKELEDGEHEVFVGVTDNAGKIVAKSNPFTFVKEAQAFTPVDAEASLVSGAGSQAPSFFSQQALIIALGGVVIALGLILLMISMYLIRRQETKPTLDTAHVG